MIGANLMWIRTMRECLIGLVVAFALAGCKSETVSEEVKPIEFGVGAGDENKLNFEELLNMNESDAVAEISNSLNYLEQFDFSDFNSQLPQELGFSDGELLRAVEGKIFKFLHPKESEKADVQLGVDVKHFDNKTILLATKLGVDDPVMSAQQILIEFDTDGKMIDGGIRYQCLNASEPNTWVKKC